MFLPDLQMQSVRLAQLRVARGMSQRCRLWENEVLSSD